MISLRLTGAIASCMLAFGLTTAACGRACTDVTRICEDGGPVVPPETPEPQDPPIALTNVTVLPMDGPARAAMTVIIQNGRVTTLGPTTATAPPANAIIVNAHGKYLMPGLIDAHTHLTVLQDRGLAERVLALSALRGVTTIRMMYTEGTHAALRARVNAGQLFGSYMVLASPSLVPGSVMPENAASVVAGYKASGYDFIKVMQLDEITFDSVAAAAARLGIAVAGHVPPDVGLRRAAAAYLSLEHLDGFLEALQPGASPPGGFFGLNVAETASAALIDSVVAMVKASGAAVVPTEHAMELWVTAAPAQMPDAGLEYMPPALVTAWRNTNEGFVASQATPSRAAAFTATRRQLIDRLQAAGVPVLVGSDALNMFDVPGFGMLQEMRTLEIAGLSREEVLAAATVVPARVLNVEGRGVIRVGAVADLLLLDADPREDLGALARIAGVMIRGTWLDQTELTRRLALLHAN